LMSELGMPIRTAGSMVSLHPPADPLAIRGFEVDLPGDISAAAFVLVAAELVPGSNVSTRRTGLNPTRAGILEVIRAFGGHMGITPKGDSLGEPWGDADWKTLYLTARTGLYRLRLNVAGATAFAPGAH